MGYSTSFNLKLMDASGTKELTREGLGVIKEFCAECEWAGYCLLDTGESNDSGKWYDHQQDLEAFSKKYPEILFRLEGDGEDSGDFWHLYVRNGKSQKVKAVITYPPFNPDTF